MAEESGTARGYHRGRWVKRGGGGPGPAYFLGFIGAAVYYLQQATTFWAGLIGLLKAIVWPAYLIYQLLKFIGA